MSERRSTRQNAAIKDVIGAARRPLSIDEVHEAASLSVPEIGLRTVYRAVRRLEEDGELARVPVSGQSDRYELAEIASHHHHHFHCLSCDRLFDVKGCPGRMEKLVPNGFVLEGHEITLHGTCDRCS